MSYIDLLIACLHLYTLSSVEFNYYNIVALCLCIVIATMSSPLFCMRTTCALCTESGTLCLHRDNDSASFECCRRAAARCILPPSERDMVASVSLRRAAFWLTYSPPSLSSVKDSDFLCTFMPRMRLFFSTMGTCYASSCSPLDWRYCVFRSNASPHLHVAKEDLADDVDDDDDDNFYVVIEANYPLLFQDILRDFALRGFELRVIYMSRATQRSECFFYRAFHQLSAFCDLIEYGSLSSAST